MDKLKAAKLHGDELVLVTGSLAKRYNGCLAMLGVKETKLTSFSIDAMGWSPEIAEEKNDNFYLNIGEANANAIIISPDQEARPVHMPFHSFDRDVMRTVFVAYKREIKDITKDSGICVLLDQNIDAYYDPLDLLRYKKIELSFKLLNDIDKTQAEQLQLIKEFNKDNNFINTKLHKQLLDSAKTYGDLRKRKLQLEPLTLNISSFYTKAFGGVFILRDFVKDVLVFESKETFNKAIKDAVHDVVLYHIEHDELLETLTDYFIISKDFKKTSKTKRYQRIKNHLFTRHLKDTEHPLKEILDSPFLFKKYLNTLDTETQKQISCVEQYFQRVIVERDLQFTTVVNKTYFKALHQPHSSLTEEQKELIWKLLSKVMPVDPLHLYWFDKDKFYETYVSWRPSYQEWVINCILDNNKNFSV
ncbi:DUF6638 family protein [Patiriisocius hiemis]|uniref:DUF6638 family protein n=1 Tax=Patiriisocius hiemis TaxID=3075604 RepID=A0ABU2YDD4_9FLAO|nr:DUF6638 family protein [Constantimarinum sp. W242]MDT0555810.1 DUF6638 family protein [Constantimarinum sp. W242]